MNADFSSLFRRIINFRYKVATLLVARFSIHFLISGFTWDKVSSNNFKNNKTVGYKLIPIDVRYCRLGAFIFIIGASVLSGPYLGCCHKLWKKSGCDCWCSFETPSRKSKISLVALDCFILL
jgi:hypothetical protein